MFILQKCWRVASVNRFYCTRVAPKITTHYTIVPRETDPRWEGFHGKKGDEKDVVIVGGGLLVSYIR
ncbi:hypothetical protein AVEN_58532-1 [Araneus ventricosus]|uniref:Uncharacterized protein n=1 Tax=Araneus ventricosus TaxID=182803 RepID=A0A4Y2RWQ8_ARAVE|nr:hypothetical protein AVEN_58532-1 [Araneus ventricosus]